MAMTKSDMLHIVRFIDLEKWSAHDTVFDNMGNRFPLVPLSKVLKRVKEPILIEDGTLYKRITVRLYGQGVLQRDKVLGKEIGTKRQFIAHAGQLIISRIDARNGAFGIVPSELEGAIVTNDFWLFEVQNALPEYLMLVLSSEPFQKYWQTQSSGTTNRQRVSESDFLSSRIILPPKTDQFELLSKYHAAVKKADYADKEATKTLENLNNKICEIMDVSFVTSSLKGIFSQVSFRHLSRWDPTYLASRVVVQSKYPMVPLSRVINHFLVDNDGQSLRHNTKDEENHTYQYIGMEHIEKNTGRRTPKVVQGSEILSQTLSVPEGYMIYGKLRPYLNKYWENKTRNEDIICSSEFFVFDTTGVDRDYFVAVLSSEIVQRQLPSLYSGARMPRITEDDFFSLLIPFPPERIQKDIALLSRKEREKGDSLQSSAISIRQSAKREFEEAVFGEI